MTTRALDARVALPERTSDTVHIVGFAPSWSETPWDTPAEKWGMNSLHHLAGDKKWSAWFQLHDIDKHHPADKTSHVKWLMESGIPVYMWEHHIEKYPLPNAVPYPRNEILEHFGTEYFTNSVSWMIAYAIYREYQNIGVFGIDMAQDSEYMNQRPSCEFFLGYAVGKGLNVYIPPSSDLLKAPYQYGYQDGDAFRVKLEARLEDLQKRLGEMENQRNQSQSVALQLMGAIEDTQYYLRAWSQPRNDGKANS